MIDYRLLNVRPALGVFYLADAKATVAPFLIEIELNTEAVIQTTRVNVEVVRDDPFSD